MVKKLFFIISIVVFTSFSQQLKVGKIEPPNWWANMKLNKIQLMVYGESLDGIKAKFDNNGIKVVKISPAKTGSYSFIDVEIGRQVKPGDYKLTITKDGNSITVQFPINARVKDVNRYRGFNNKDVIYLLMPDRFCNGDTKNDNVDGYEDKLNPSDKIGRHGGDIQGIINKLDYLNDLGVTALWLTPLVENNSYMGYHGYLATDHYKIDPRLGDIELYKNMISEADKRGIKIILDHVANHISVLHPWIKNLPFDDWINGTVKEHLPASHYKSVFTDPYADSSSMFNVTKGWFTDYMPDLNQRNPFVAKYIIQNTIWWVETAGLDGIREDTYPYVDQKFMSDWAKIVLDEYPTMNIVGEVWTGEPAFLTPYQKGSAFKKDFDSNMPSIIDFAFRDNFYKYYSGEGNLYGIYELMTKDYIYPDPNNLVTFVDNHDIARIMFYAKGNVSRVKNSLFMLFTLRGIPQMLYGTEIGMVGSEDHGILRTDFPGGFPHTDRDAFTSNGRTKEENDLFNYVRQLLHLRKDYPAITEGKMIHYPPYDTWAVKGNQYLYFKIKGNQIVLCVVNDDPVSVTVDLSLYPNVIKNVTNVKDLLNNKELGKTTKLVIEPNSSSIFELK